MDCKTLSNEELLASLIGVSEARAAYRGALLPLFASPSHTPNHRKLCVALELVKRAIAEELIKGPAFAHPSEVQDFLKVHFLGQAHESFVVLFLDVRNRLIAAEDMFQGTASRVSVCPRQLIKRVLELNAASVIFAHNHPDGDVRPSEPDKWLTKSLSEALRHVEVSVLDHIVVAGGKTASMAELGLLTHPSALSRCSEWR